MSRLAASAESPVSSPESTAARQKLLDHRHDAIMGFFDCVVAGVGEAVDFGLGEYLLEAFEEVGCEACILSSSAGFGKDATQGWVGRQGRRPRVVCRAAARYAVALCDVLTHLER